MATPSKSDKTADKMIDSFKDKADDVVDDARQGETDDNPVKKIIRDHPQSKEGDNKSREANQNG